MTGPGSTRTREECVRMAGERLARAAARVASMSPAEAAAAAWVPGGPSIAQLEARIRAERAGEQVAA